MDKLTFFIRVSAFSVVVGLATAGCHSWPPQEARFTETFEQYRSDFLELSSLLATNNYGEAFYSVKASSIRVKTASPTQMVTVTGVAASEIRGKLEELGLYGVVRSSVLVRYEIAPLTIRGKRYLVSYNNGNAGSTLAMCDGMTAKTDEGQCQVQLDEAWWIEYRWFGSD